MRRLFLQSDMQGTASKFYSQVGSGPQRGFGECLVDRPARFAANQLTARLRQDLSTQSLMFKNPRFKFEALPSTSHHTTVIERW